jgi:hypothetical protein
MLSLNLGGFTHIAGIGTGPRPSEHGSYVDRCRTRAHSNASQNSVLAVQNMEASGTIAKSQEIEFRALEGSLSMMSKGNHWLAMLFGD